jgi:tRNASer (uridine44-2'-O)-methyltransferase
MLIFSQPRCGNGLLTHILTSEGYYGTGIDLRARTSWSHYPPSTQARLQVHALDPLSLHPNDPQSHEAAISPLPSFLAPGVFIIANHADELTPWTPLLATLTNASGYLSIPCCAWSFDAKFERGVASNGPVPSIIQPGENANESLAIGGGNVGATSAYALYRVWLANLSLWCGWENEYENLRIPSTRNWAIVGE